MMNTGRKAIKYEGRLPDGRIIQQRSFSVNEPVALIGCFQVRGRGLGTQRACFRSLLVRKRKRNALTQV
jgi:hypothetical protein